MKVCPACTVENTDTALVCSCCDSPLGKNVPPHTAVMEPPPPSNKIPTNHLCNYHNWTESEPKTSSKSSLLDMLKKLPQPHHNPVPIDTRRIMVNGTIMIKCTACGVYALNLETNHLGRCLDCSGERAGRDTERLLREVADLKSRNAKLQMNLQFLKLEKEGDSIRYMDYIIRMQDCYNADCYNVLYGDGRKKGAPDYTVFRSSGDPVLDVQLKCFRVVKMWKDFVSMKKKYRLDLLTQLVITWRIKNLGRFMERKRRDREDQGIVTALHNLQREGISLTYDQVNFLKIYKRDFLRHQKTFHCPICMEHSGLNGTIVISGCLHSVCVEDMESYVISKLDDGSFNRITCPYTNCKERVPFADIELSLRRQPAQFARFQKFLTEHYLEVQSDFVRCPKPACQTPMIKSSAAAKMCICPEKSCNFTFCSSCKVEWHSDITCEAYQQWRKDNEKADDFFDQWRIKNTKPCPQCKSPIEKNGGCNHMTCGKCRYEFCWLCLGLYTSDHYSRGACSGLQHT